MRESLQFERCPPANGERIPQEHLKGDHDGLPPEGFMAGIRRQLRSRAAVYAARHRIEPAMGNVLLTQASGIAVPF
jgi:hypothetical protein